jgi:uncharacterized protein (DUF58 family)
LSTPDEGRTSAVRSAELELPTQGGHPGLVRQVIRFREARPYRPGSPPR